MADDDHKHPGGVHKTKRGRKGAAIHADQPSSSAPLDLAKHAAFMVQQILGGLAATSDSAQEEAPVIQGRSIADLAEQFAREHGISDRSRLEDVFIKLSRIKDDPPKLPSGSLASLHEVHPTSPQQEKLRREILALSGRLSRMVSGSACPMGGNDHARGLLSALDEYSRYLSSFHYVRHGKGRPLDLKHQRIFHILFEAWPHLTGDEPSANAPKANQAKGSRFLDALRQLCRLLDEPGTPPPSASSVRSWIKHSQAARSTKTP